MPILSGFFDSLNGDRQYDAETFSIPFSHIIEEGVFANWGELFRVISNDGLTTTVKTGAAWCLSTWTRLDEWLIMTHDSASASMHRIDRIVLRVDKRPAARTNDIIILKGTDSANPVPPTMMNTDVVKDLLIADVRINAGTSAIAQTSITNYVGTKTTPYVTAPLTKVDVSPIIEQMNSEFESWFVTVQGTLEGDVAANLASKVAALEEKDISQDKAIIEAANKAETSTKVDTGWVPITTTRAGWKAGGNLEARAYDGRLYVTGTISRTTSLRDSVSASVIMADLPPVIIDALKGGTGKAYSCGGANSASGFYCQIYASNTILGLNYRNRNPYTGEVMALHVNGALP